MDEKTLPQRQFRTKGMIFEVASISGPVQVTSCSLAEEHERSNVEDGACSSGVGIETGIVPESGLGASAGPATGQILVNLRRMVVCALLPDCISSGKVSVLKLAKSQSTGLSVFKVSTATAKPSAESTAGSGFGARFMPIFSFKTGLAIVVAGQHKQSNRTAIIMEVKKKRFWIEP